MTTKYKLCYNAVKMFTEYGYDNISMRDLAKSVGITNPSIYNHYASKKDILKHMYQCYSIECKKVLPDVNELLKLAETMNPHELLMFMQYRVPNNDDGIMDNILVIAARRFSFDPDSMQFIIDNVITPTTALTVPVITKLIELDKIEPIDVKTFNVLLLHYCLSSIILNATSMKMDYETWLNGLKFIHDSCIKIKNK